MPRSSAWVSNPPRLTEYTRAGAPASTQRATTSSWAASAPCSARGTSPSRSTSCPEGVDRAVQVGDRARRVGLQRRLPRGRPAERRERGRERPARQGEPAQRQRGARRGRARQHRRQHRLQRHGEKRVAAVGVQPATDPAGARGVVGRGGLPDVHRPEVAVVGLRVADAADDRQRAVVPLLLEARETRVEAEAFADVEHLALAVGEVGARRLVGGVGRGHHRVEPVVAAVEGDEDEHAGADGQRVGAGAVGEVLPADAGRRGRDRRGARGEQEPASGQCCSCAHAAFRGGSAVATSCGGLPVSGASAAAVRGVKAGRPSRARGRGDAGVRRGGGDRGESPTFTTARARLQPGQRRRGGEPGRARGPAADVGRRERHLARGPVEPAASERRGHLRRGHVQRPQRAREPQHRLADEHRAGVAERRACGRRPAPGP